MSKTIFLCAAAAAFLSTITADAHPEVFSLDFTKEIRRDSPEANRLARRQNTVQADINNENILYLINVTIGSPPRKFALQLDTGSSDIWVPSVNSNICQFRRDACYFGAYDRTASTTFHEITPGGFEISYQDNSRVTGDYFSDTLTIGTQSIKTMQMGLALDTTRGLGIMGIGFTSGESIVAIDPDEKYPNVISQLKSQKFINRLSYSLWLNDLDSDQGSILFGGVDTEKYHGDLTVLPIQPDSQSGDISSFTVALAKVSLANKSGASQYSKDNLAVPIILDSGTTNTYLPDDLANAIAGGVGAVSDPTFGFIVPCSLKGSGAVLTFTFGASNGPAITVGISEFVTDLFPEPPPPKFPDSKPACRWGLQPAGNNPILFGDTFLRSAYVVYNIENEQIGIAQTNFNTTKSNTVAFSGTNIPNASSTASGAAVTQTYSGYPLETDAVPTAIATATKITVKDPKPTFDLGQYPGNSAAVGLKAPSFEMATLVTGAILALSCILGGSMVFMM